MYRHKTRLTVNRVLLNDLHCPHDAWYFAVGMVKECHIALHHKPHIVPCCQINKSLIQYPTDIIYLPTGLRTPANVESAVVVQYKYNTNAYHPMPRGR